MDPSDEELNSDSSMRNYGLLWLFSCIPVGYFGVYEPLKQAERQVAEIHLWPGAVCLFVLLALYGLIHVLAGCKARHVLIYRKQDISVLSVLMTGAVLLLGIAAQFYFEYFLEQHYGYEF